MSVVLPAPLVPTMATTSPGARGEGDAAQHGGVGRPRSGSRRRGTRSRAPCAAAAARPAAPAPRGGCPAPRRCGRRAASAPCRVALTRESRLIGVYIAKSAARNDVKAPVVSRPDADGGAAVEERAHQGHAAHRLHERRQDGGRARDAHVHVEEAGGGAPEARGLEALHPEGLDHAEARRSSPAGSPRCRASGAATSRWRRAGAGRAAPAGRTRPASRTARAGPGASP